MMSLQRNYYEVLGLPPGATTDQIKKKYRELARQFHPDVVSDKNMGQRVFSQINQAYSVLGNPERRAQYNGTLQNTATPLAATAAPQAGTIAKPAAAPTVSAPQPPPAKPVSPVKTQAFAEMLSRAENAVMAGKPVETRAFCVRILEADPHHVRALELLGDALFQMGRLDEAAVQYRQALQFAPSQMVQAKLNRATAAATPTRTNLPQNGSGVQKTLPPTAGKTEAPEKPGLLGRLLGRK